MATGVSKANTVPIDILTSHICCNMPHAAIHHILVLFYMHTAEINTQVLVVENVVMSCLSHLECMTSALSGAQG